MEADFKVEYVKAQARLEAAIPKIFEPYTTAFVTIVPDNKVVMFGSGSLLQIASSYFAITAAHIFDDTKKLKLPVGFIAGSKDDPAIFEKNLNGFMIRDDAVDICVIRLSERAVHTLTTAGRKFLRLSDIDAFDSLGNGKIMWYSIFGYPEKRGELGEILHNDAVFYATTTCENKSDELNRISDYNPKVHIALHFDPENVIRLGASKPLPPPAGYSGCAVWRITHVDGLYKITSFDPTNIRLVGIETGWYKPQKVMKATKIIYAIDAIRQHCPDLRSAIDLHFAPAPELVIQVRAPIAFQ